MRYTQDSETELGASELAALCLMLSPSPQSLTSALRDQAPRQNPCSRGTREERGPAHGPGLLWLLHDRESGGFKQFSFLLTQFWSLKGHHPFQWGQCQGVDRAASSEGSGGESVSWPSPASRCYLLASFQSLAYIVTSPIFPLILLCPLL